MAAHETNESRQGQGQGREQGQAQGSEGGGDSDTAARTHLSVAGLRARGWTAGMVRQLLGEPDQFRVNPHVRAAPRIRLYCVERVEAAERSEEFRAVSAAAARRSAAARVAARRRRREVLTRIAAEELLRRRVYAAITEAYPLLAQECERRLSEREFGPPPE
ncbi:hypothetical protein [Streptomyces prunicolor]|uniref:hypothetical protein n=1 Tax=Streptomyces prunicolor TaxID=67348 RepID=UPI001FE1E60B|nr:hypothetical protein [Streptomyces prunicolor]